MLDSTLSRGDRAAVPVEDRFVYRFLEAIARRTPQATAIAAPGRNDLSFERLLEQIDRTVAQLNALGVGRRDRVALVVPNGPEAGTAFLAISACCTCAPLNPGYRAREFDFYMTDLETRALVIDADLESPARSVARARGIPIIELVVKRDEPAGVFELQGEPIEPASEGGLLRPEDVAIVVHTSGTTARPKIVPLTQRNLYAAARDMRAAHELTAGDRYLNILPMFHMHSLNSLLCALEAGGSTYCAPGFDPNQFWTWLDEYRPTWFTAVPTIYQAILEQVPHHRDVIARSQLRFIRSASASLPRTILLGLEEAFGVPLIEAYAMNESTQITTNPLPPRERKVGSVGLPCGPEVVLLDEAGNPLPPGELGEVAVRGEVVLSGYASNPEANAKSFVNGWFRTGDLGYFDEDGYLYLTGRVKEVINRGGEKIAPAEVDAVLLEHPAVAQAVVFAMPHPRLGEEVAAAVILRDPASAGPPEVMEQTLRSFVAARLADFKVPRRIVFVDQIPMGPTGKLQRIGLAEKLGLTGIGKDPSNVAPVAEPRNEVEETLVEIWKSVLGVERVGIDDDFFELGGESVLAACVVAEIEKYFGKRLPLSAFVDRVTIADLARLIYLPVDESAWSPLVGLQTRGSRPPFFCVHPIGGHVLSYRLLAQHLGQGQPFYGLQAYGLDDREPPLLRIEEMAARHVAAIRSVQPHGPYYLGGYSFGGSVALEIAQQLQAAGETVAVLAIFDQPIKHARSSFRPDQLAGFVRNLPGWIGDTARRSPEERASLVREHAGIIARRIRRRIEGRRLESMADAESEVNQWVRISEWPELWRRVAIANHRALQAYRPRPYLGRVTLFRAKRQPLLHFRGDDLGWRDIALGGLDIYEVPGHHLSIMEEPNVRVLSEQLRTVLDAGYLRGAQPRVAMSQLQAAS